MNFLKRLFNRKPDIYELRQKYFDEFIGDYTVTEAMNKADKVSNWIVYGKAAGGSGAHRTLGEVNDGAD